MGKGNTRLPSPEDALVGSATPLAVPERHFVNGARLQPPYPEGLTLAMFGLGCFWGAERLFWELPDVYSTAVGYAGGHTVNPTYQQVCTGRTGHAEVVRVVYDPKRVSYQDLLQVFWEAHDPTQGMRQGNDVGTQYRSCIYTYDETQEAAAVATREAYQRVLQEAGYAAVTTEIATAPAFYFAEAYHQQYLAKHPDGYCGLDGTGVSCPR